MGRSKLHCWLQCKQQFKYSRVILALAFIVGIGGCIEPEVSVEIEDEQSMAKYVELLDAYKFAYTIDEAGVIHVRASPEELSSVREEYHRWEVQKYQSEGVLILDD